MSTRLSIAAALTLVASLLAAPAAAHDPSDDAAAEAALTTARGSDAEVAAVVGEERAENFELVGHDPLFNRGMNAAIAVHGDHAYIGNRTDGSPHHPRPGVLVVDISDPSDPEVVNEIGPPHEGNVGETSRELRVWPQQDLLMVLNFGCSSAIHACTAGEFRGDNISFFDISGENAADPKHVATYEASRTPHEFFLWVDPARPAERALLFMSTPTSATKGRPNIIVTDISKARDGEFTEVAEWVTKWPARMLETGEAEDRRLHSIGVSTDGTRTYLAFLGAGFAILDTSEVVAGVEDPQIRSTHDPVKRVHWSNPGAHSAVKVPGRDYALVTDEVYGDALEALAGEWGCPWGWAHTIDISDESTPALVGEFQAEQNTLEYCDDPTNNEPSNTTFTSFSAHNPTLTPDLAFVTWHSAGMLALDITDPTLPTQAGLYDPEPLPFVHTEDPALNLGRDKTTMWSYPIVKDGLVYVIDIRNGLYILRYTGPQADEVASIGFLEGNSNLGDALRFEPVDDRPGRQPPDRGERGGGGTSTGLLGGLAAALVAGIGLRRRRRPARS